jgi:hypothetical protein
MSTSRSSSRRQLGAVVKEKASLGPQRWRRRVDGDGCALSEGRRIVRRLHLGDSEVTGGYTRMGMRRVGEKENAIEASHIRFYNGRNT